MVAIGFGGRQGLQGPRDQRARKAIPASPDRQVLQVQSDQQVQSGRQAPKVHLDPGDPRGLEILHNNREAASVGGLAS